MAEYIKSVITTTGPWYQVSTEGIRKKPLKFCFNFVLTIKFIYLLAKCMKTPAKEFLFK